MTKMSCAIKLLRQCIRISLLAMVLTSMGVRADDEDISLGELADYLNQIIEFPHRYTPHITGLSLVADDESLHYWYEIARPLGSINIKEFAAAVQTDKKPSACELLSFGVIGLTEIRHSYKDINGQYVGSFTFAAEDC